MPKIKKFSIIIPDERASTGRIVDYAKAVKKGLTDNADRFPTAVPLRLELETSITTLEGSIPAKGDRSINTSLRVLENKREVLRILNALASIVMGVANGNRFVATLSGFELTKEVKAILHPGEFTVIVNETGSEEGTVEIELSGREGNAVFIVERKVGDAWVIIDAFNTINFVVKGLPPGQSILRIYGKKGDKLSPSVEVIVKAL